MLLLLDEDAKAKLLVKLLTQAGHDVATTTDLGLDGQPDDKVLQAARNSNRVLLTFNCSDFLDLHNVNQNHPGIIATYQDGNPVKRLSSTQIVNAIGNLLDSGHKIQSNFHALNRWLY